MRLTPKTTISKILWLFLLKKPYHLCLENSILKEVKIAHILKTIQLFDSIFFPDVIFPPQLSITTQKTIKKCLKTPEIMLIIKIYISDILKTLKRL